MVGREHHRAFVATGKEHRAGVGVVHFRGLTVHEHQHLHRRRIFYLHALDQFAEAIKCGALIPHQVRGLGHNRAGDDEIAAAGKDLLRSPSVMRVEAIAHRDQGAGIKYNSRRGCGHG